MSQTFRDATNRSLATTPVAKMSRKMSEISMSKTPGSANRLNLTARLGTKTPNQSFNQSMLGGKGKGLKKREVTPSRNATFSSIGGGDRYVPNRSHSQFELANYLMNQPAETSLNTSSSAPNSPQKNPEKELHMQLMRVKSASDLSGIDDQRIFVYKKNMAPLPPVGHLNQPKVLYSATAKPTSSVKKTSRHIPTAPERILDAPCFLDDYYTNLLDWSSVGIVAVALGFELYLWNSETGDIQNLLSLDDTNDNNVITSVRWAADGRYLALGTMDGTIRLYDPTRAERPELRKMTLSRVSRVGCLSWRSHVLSAGHRSGQILHHDVRVAQHNIGMFEGHSQEVCGLKWSPDGNRLASGAGDNLVNVWSGTDIGNSSQVAPEHTFDEHMSTVKAIAWCPWKAHTLASGGGNQDRTVKLWDVSTGTLTKSVDAQSQVTDILFNSDYKEMITSHGIPNFQLRIWKYPSMAEVATLSGHTGRVMSLSMSPCGEYVMSASADESLRLWHCFKVDKSTQRLINSRKNIGGLRATGPLR